jgi:zinc protease
MSQQPEIRRHRLSNGLRIVTAPDPRVPVVGVSLMYAVGSAHEAPRRTGFAHLFEHMMFQGSANVGETEHLRIIESVGGWATAYTSWDHTEYLDTVPSHQLPLALWMEADRLATLAEAISQESLDNQIDVVQNERRANVDNLPYGAAEDDLFAMALPDGHPYGHSRYGSMDDLEAATLEDVRSFFKTFYVPNNAVLVLVGDFEVGPALELVDRYFGAIPAGPDPALLDGAVSLDLAAPIRREHRAADIPVPRLFVACRVPPFGTDAWDVPDFVGDLLTSGRAARLQRRLVRELRVADAVEAATYLLVGGVSLLEIDVTASEGTEPGAVEAALADELERLAVEPPDDQELARVSLRRATIHAITMQESEERAERIGLYTCLLDEPERFGQEGARDLMVTADAIAEFARGPLSERNRVSLWYLPSGE